MSEFEREQEDDTLSGTTDSFVDDLLGSDNDEGLTEKSKKKKNKKKKKTKGRKGDSKSVVILISIAVAFIVWVVLLVIQDRIVNAAITSPVVVAICEVPEGIELTQENMSGYFTVEQRPVEQIPVSVTTYKSGALMVGLITDRVIREKEIVTSDCFYVENFLDEVENGVEISIDLGSLGQSVAGTIEAGDFVNIRSVIQIKQESLMNIDGAADEMGGEYPGGLLDITPVTEESEQSGNSSRTVIDFSNGFVQTGSGLANFDLSYGVTGEYVVQNVAEKVRVTKVFNSGGESAERVAANNGVMIATIIKVVVPQEKATAILLALAEGDIYVEKVIDPDYVAPVVVEDSFVNQDIAVEVETTEKPAEEVTMPDVTIIGEYNDVNREDGVVVFTREDGIIIRVDTTSGQVLHALPEEKAEDGFITFSGLEGDGYVGTVHEGITDDGKKVKVDENGVLYSWDEESGDWGK